MPFFHTRWEGNICIVVLLENHRWPVRRRINEATAFIKLFKIDKKAELRKPSGISRKMNHMLKINRVKCN